MNKILDTILVGLALLILIEILVIAGFFITGIMPDLVNKFNEWYSDKEQFNESIHICEKYQVSNGDLVNENGLSEREADLMIQINPHYEWAKECIKWKDKTKEEIKNYPCEIGNERYEWTYNLDCNRQASVEDWKYIQNLTFNQVSICRPINKTCEWKGEGISITFGAYDVAYVNNTNYINHTYLKHGNW